MENPLKIKRQSLNISKEDMAKFLNIKIFNIREYEYGRRTPNAKELLYICRNGYKMSDKEIIEYLEYLDTIR